MAERRPYDDVRWKPLRVEILTRDGWACRECGKPADRVDHVKPWRQGGAWFDPANLEAVCRSCNTKRAYRSGGRSGRGERDQGPRTALTW